MALDPYKSKSSRSALAFLLVMLMPLIGTQIFAQTNESLENLEEFNLADLRSSLSEIATRAPLSHQLIKKVSRVNGVITALRGRDIEHGHLFYLNDSDSAGFTYCLIGAKNKTALLVSNNNVFIERAGIK